MPAQEGRSPQLQSGSCGHTRGLLEEGDAHCGEKHRHSTPKPGGCLAESLCPPAQEHEAVQEASTGPDPPLMNVLTWARTPENMPVFAPLFCSDQSLEAKVGVSLVVKPSTNIIFYFSGNLPTLVPN